MDPDTTNELLIPRISISINSRDAKKVHYENEAKIDSVTVSKLNTTTHALKEHNAMEMALLRSKAKNLIRKRLKYRRGGCYKYQEPLTIDKIEEMVPPSILVLFLSSYLVQVPTTLQVITAYNDRLWGKEKVTTVRILCSLSVNFSSLTSKRAAVTWLVRNISAMDSVSKQHKKRLAKSWNKAIAEAEKVQLGEHRQVEKARREQIEKNKKLKEKLDNDFSKGRKFEEKRFQTLQLYLKKYPDIDLSRKKTVNAIILEGNRKEDQARDRTKNLKTKIKLMKMFEKVDTKNQSESALNEDEHDALKKLRRSLLTKKALSRFKGDGMNPKSGGETDGEQSEGATEKLLGFASVFGLNSPPMKRRTLFGAVKNMNEQVARGQVRCHETKTQSNKNESLEPSPPLHANKANTYPPRTNRFSSSALLSFAKEQGGSMDRLASP